MHEDGSPASLQPDLGAAAAGEPARAILAAATWYQTFPAPARLSSANGHARVLVNRFVGIPPEMIQPALMDNVVALHLGGPKRVNRWHDGRKTVQDVELGSLTIMPARQENRWLTEGPIDFAHLTLTTGYLRQVVVEEFDREPAACELVDRVGAKAPILEHLFRALLQTLERGGFEGRLYPESLLAVLTVALLEEYSTLGSRHRVEAGRSNRGYRKGGLASWQLRRVVDHMAAFLATDIALDEMTRLTGLSRAQFFRAFKQSTGQSPFQFLTRMRVDRARGLLETSDLSLDSVSLASGFARTRCFTAAFKQQVGLHPKFYRASRG